MPKIQSSASHRPRCARWVHLCPRANLQQCPTSWPPALPSGPANSEAAKFRWKMVVSRCLCDMVCLWWMCLLLFFFPICLKWDPQFQSPTVESWQVGKKGTRFVLYTCRFFSWIPLAMAKPHDKSQVCPCFLQFCPHVGVNHDLHSFWIIATSLESSNSSEWSCQTALPGPRGSSDSNGFHGFSSCLKLFLTAKYGREKDINLSRNSWIYINQTNVSSILPKTFIPTNRPQRTAARSSSPGPPSSPESRCPRLPPSWPPHCAPTRPGRCWRDKRTATARASRSRTWSWWVGDNFWGSWMELQMFGENGKIMKNRTYMTWVVECSDWMVQNLDEKTKPLSLPRKTLKGSLLRWSQFLKDRSTTISVYLSLDTSNDTEDTSSSIIRVVRLNQHHTRFIKVWGSYFIIIGDDPITPSVNNHKCPGTIESIPLRRSRNPPHKTKNWKWRLQQSLERKKTFQEIWFLWHLLAGLFDMFDISTYQPLFKIHSREHQRNETKDKQKNNPGDAYLYKSTVEERKME